MHSTPRTPAPARPQPRGRSGSLTWPALLTLALALSALIIPAPASIYVQKLTLDGLTAKADRIVRGTVTGVTHGEVQAGGGTLPTVTYRVQVKESLAGKPGYAVINLTMITDRKAPVQHGNARREKLLEMPELTEGQEYLLFTTRPSKAGLSSFVGLAQGCFAISARGDKEFALNGVNNAGLGLAAAGPVEYRELATKIRALLAK